MKTGIGYRVSGIGVSAGPFVSAGRPKRIERGELENGRKTHTDIDG
jgi:hypothetical protein